MCTTVAHRRVHQSVSSAVGLIQRDLQSFGCDLVSEPPCDGLVRVKEYAHVHLPVVVSQLRRERMNGEQHDIAGLAHSGADHTINRRVVGRVVVLETAVDLLNGEPLVKAQHITLDCAPHKVLVAWVSVRVRQQPREPGENADTLRLPNHLAADGPCTDVPPPVSVEPLAIGGAGAEGCRDTLRGMLAGQDKRSRIGRAVDLMALEALVDASHRGILQCATGNVEMGGLDDEARSGQTAPSTTHAGGSTYNVDMATDLGVYNIRSLWTGP